MMNSKTVFFFIILSFINSLVFGQCFEKETLYQTARKTGNSALPRRQKLDALYSLKKRAEACGQMNDTGYLLVLRQLAFLEEKNRRYDSSIRFTCDVVHIGKSLHSPSLLDDYSNLASYYFRAQYYDNALACYDTVILLKTQAGRHNSFDIERYYRSLCYFNLGDYQRSVDESTTGIMSMSTKEDSSYYLLFLNYRAQSFLFENHYPEALADVETTIHLLTQKGDHYELASAYKTKAGILEKEKKYAEAELLFTKAITERLTTKLFAQVASDYNDLGNFYANSLHHYGQSQICYDKAILYAWKGDDPKERSRKLFMAYTNMGNCYAAIQNLTEAALCYRRAIVSANIPVADFLHQNPSLRQLEVLENKDLVWSLLNGKTELLLQYFKQTKQALYLQSCLQTAKLTDSFITQIRHEHVSETSKLHWRDKTRAFFADAVEACYLLHDAENAFYFMEKSRAVLLNDKLNELGASAHLPYEEAEKEENLEQQILTEQQLISSLPPSGKEYKNATYHFLQTKAEQERYIKSLEQKYPVYYQYKYDDNVPSLSSLQSYLNKNKLSFVYYFTSDSAVYALGISKKENPVFIRITAANFDTHQLSDFVSLCSNRELLNSHYPYFTELSQNIYTKLFKPLHISKGDVAICTDAFFIPFEALSISDKQKNFLLYSYRFSYVYSARSLTKSFTGNTATGSFIGFAPVSFFPSSGLFALQGSAAAIEKSADWYNDHNLFTEETATRNNFFTNISHYSVVTIFSHAKADTTSAEPILYMSDSLIRLSELQRLEKPSIQLVLLSACQTNIGKNATGEGIYSLARGFASAGIPSVSATLWKANEEAVYKISELFNHYLSKGMNKDEALQKAKIDYLRSSDHEHTLPYYWANMVLIGSSQPVILTSSNSMWYWIAAFFIFIMASFFYYIYYKRKQGKSLV